MTSYFAKIPRSESNLLLLPRELRHEIFGYLIPDRIHVYHRGDKFCLSACVGPTSIGGEDSSKPYVDLFANMPDGFERKSSPVTYPDPIWARRLQSTWGPHWKCEENTLDEHKEGKIDATLLTVCKSV